MAFMNMFYQTSQSEAKKILNDCKKSKKRDLENEKRLLRYKEYAISYASNIIKGRWEDLEKIFLRSNGRVNSKEIVLYCRRVIKKRWIKSEKKILLYSDASYYYSLYIIKGRWKKGEKKISNSPYYSFLYAKHVLKDYFELGNDLILDSDYAKDYRQFLIDINKVEYLL
jgi:hypothetical protein